MAAYVPPHLRNKQKQSGGTIPNNTSNSNNNNYNKQLGGGGGGNGNRNFGNRRQGGGGGGGGGSDSQSGGMTYNNNRSNYQPPQDGHGGGGGIQLRQPNSRWNNFQSDDRSRGRGRREDNGGNGGYRGGNFRGGNNRGGGGSSKNNRGFHGKIGRNANTERNLFGDVQNTGINFDKYDDIPVEVGGENCPDPVSEFNSEVLGSDLSLACQLSGFQKPTPVQKYAIPIGLADRDLMACAQTGSGKTAGFLFPCIIKLLREGPLDEPEDHGHGRYGKAFPSCLILSPTRELAIQIHEEARKFTYSTGIRPCCIYGGADAKNQLRDLERGCDILTATPGRLTDFIERGRVSMGCIRILIMDEADRMLDMGKKNSFITTIICYY
jgi:ATP-dependent RNA helicase DDX3X